ncbi:hypothetical protein ACWEDZ_04210 [Streptomyces sp. NPDC005047]
MTETMRVLKCLREKGECTLLQVVDATDIPAGRTIAALGALTRSQDAVKTQRDGFARFTITNAGREKVESWDIPTARPAQRREVRRAR